MLLAVKTARRVYNIYSSSSTRFLVWICTATYRSRTPLLLIENSRGRREMLLLFYDYDYYYYCNS